MPARDVVLALGATAPGGEAPTYVPAGASFEDAVRMAQMRSLEHPVLAGHGAAERWSGTHAQAVLQAADGAYWITGLSDVSDRSLPVVIDGAAVNSIALAVSAEPLLDDVKAIVGKRRVFDLSAGNGQQRQLVTDDGVAPLALPEPTT